MTSAAAPLPAASLHPALAPLWAGGRANKTASWPRGRGHSVEATRQSRNNCACGKSQAGADWYCEPRSLAPRPTLPDLPRPPGVYRLPHWCIRRWPLLPSACSVLSPPAQLRRCLAHNATQKGSGNADPRNEIRIRTTKFKITEKRAEFSACAQNSDEAPIFCMALQKS